MDVKQGNAIHVHGQNRLCTERGLKEISCPCKCVFAQSSSPNFDAPSDVPGYSAFRRFECAENIYIAKGIA
jgi:hypothetical protein